MTAWLVTHPSGVRYRVREGKLEAFLERLQPAEFMIEPAPELRQGAETWQAPEMLPEGWR